MSSDERIESTNNDNENAAVVDTTDTNTTTPVVEQSNNAKNSGIKTDFAHMEYGDGEGKTDRELIFQQARDANEQEHTMPLKQVFKAYKKAIFWSLILSMCIVMESYDNSLIINVYALEAFARRYGTYYPAIDEYQIPAPWQSGLTNASNVGALFGAFAQGFLVSRFGYRVVVLSCLAFITVTIFMFFFAHNLATLVAAKLLMGLPCGAFATMGISYASEVCPLQLRGYLTEYIEICWASGQLLALGVLKAFAGHPNSQWSYRVPFAIQWVWPVPLFALLCFVPENPWWLCRHNRLDDAEKALGRLISPGYGVDIKNIVAEMLHVEELEESAVEGASYKECFQGTNLRRTEIVCITYVCQLICDGLPSPTYFFKEAGINGDVAFDLGLGLQGISWICTVFSWVVITWVGRRPLFIIGLASAAVVSFIVGFVSLAHETQGTEYGEAGLIFFLVVIYRLTAGPLTTVVVGETSSMKLRSQSVALARMSWYLATFFFNTLNNYMVNTAYWGWKGKVGFFYGAWNLAAYVWAYFRLPECGNKTPDELDIMFERKIPARNFNDYTVDPFNEDEPLTRKEGGRFSHFWFL